jgi:3'-phosphoadenosine 5'-phosphosulfate sulfotransferase (PAPS reductase)/FAD synthetase
MPTLFSESLADSPRTCVVSYSGGVTSYAAAVRCVERYGAERVLLLFADTREEHPSTYRFLVQSAELVGAPLRIVSARKRMWDVFEEEGYIGNSRADICSRVLKREVLKAYMEAHHDPTQDVIAVGYEWHERGRIAQSDPLWAPWTAISPLSERPYIEKCDVLQELSNAGIELPDLYKRGYPHNNCGGACVKAGQAQWARLLADDPDLYAYHEARERRFQELHNLPHTVLKDRRGGVSKPMSLRVFRERVEAGEEFDRGDWGGCACFSGKGFNVSSTEQEGEGR